jgi:hypothetical protein
MNLFSINKPRTLHIVFSQYITQPSAGEDVAAKGAHWIWTPCTKRPPHITCDWRMPARVPAKDWGLFMIQNRHPESGVVPPVSCVTASICTIRGYQQPGLGTVTQGAIPTKGGDGATFGLVQREKGKHVGRSTVMNGYWISLPLGR